MRVFLLTRELEDDHLVIQAESETDARIVAAEFFEQCRVKDFHEQLRRTLKYLAKNPGPKPEVPVLEGYQSPWGWGACVAWPEWLSFVEITREPVTEIKRR